jgi:NAD(P)-dependent dehydrogenase (short-subunit alcohol dehydrogenase family)
MDVTDAGAVGELVGWMEGKWRQLAALVNNAGIQLNEPVEDISQNQWQAVMDSNLQAPFVTAQACLSLLEAGKGAIVNVSSVHAVATSINLSAYAASKGGLLSLTRQMALELAPRNIRVNAVLPGAVDTEMLRSGLDRGHLAGETMENKLAALGERTPLGRVGEPAEIAQAILFLADPERSSFITGQALIVDGGATARLSTE